MLYNSLNFLIFFPIVVLASYLIPQRAKNLYLLVCSYFFYMCWNIRYVLILLLCTLITYGTGILIGMIPKEESDRQKLALKKALVGGGLALNLGILVFFKYTHFLVDNINVMLGNMGLSAVEIPFDIVLPVGISFYTFQVLGYMIDVYRGDVTAEKNFIRYALFVSFFPQVIAGPIGRSTKLLKQFEEKHAFVGERVKNGILLMLWGYFQKVVVADRIAILVDTVYNYPQYYEGFEILTATVLFAFQVYCDFAGYTNIARGAAQVMGIELTNNFASPYLARSVAEFWRRWHISLTSWFRDYLYFPLGGSRKGKLKNYRNILIIFLVSGIWHGANWTFIIWGGLNGLYQILSKVCMPVRQKLYRIFGVREEAFSHKLFQTAVTFCLIDFTWIFFRSDNIRSALTVIRRMFGFCNPWVFFDGSLYLLGLSRSELGIALLGLAVLLIVDYLHYKGRSLRQSLQKQGLWFRWMCYIGAVFVLLLLGIYGPGYDASQFIYFQF